MKSIQGLSEKLAALGVKTKDMVEEQVAAAEFVLEGLYAHKKISRSEFQDWARDYAVQLKKLAELQERIAAAERRLAGKIATVEKHRVTKELQNQRKAVTELKKQVHHLETIDKHLQQIRRQ